PKFFRIHLFVERCCANQVMRGLRECCRVGLRGQKIETTINLKRVRADNFGAYFMRDIGRQLGFAGGGRPDNKEDRFYVVTVKWPLLICHVERSRDIIALAMRDSSTSLGMTNSGWADNEERVRHRIRLVRLI